MKTDNLYRYIPSESDHARKHGYVGYIIDPNGTRSWQKTEKEALQLVDERNAQIVAMGRSAFAFLMASPGIVHLIINIVAVLKVMGMTLEDLYQSLKEKASNYLLGECLDQYLIYVKAEYRTGNMSKAYIGTVEFAIRLLQPLAGKNISRLTSKEIKEALLSCRRAGGDPYGKSSLLTVQLIGRSALTIIAKVRKENNPFVFEGFKYEPTREFATVEQWRAVLRWWLRYAPENLSYVLHRGFLGMRHQDLIGKPVWDEATQQDKWQTNAHHSDLKPEEGLTRLPTSKMKKTIFGYWPPAMKAWMDLVPKGAANSSIIAVGPNSGKPLSQTAIEDLLERSWREAVGADVPYPRNWLRHSPATYASAVFGVEVAATFIDDDVSTVRKHYDGRATKTEGIRYFNSFPPGFTGKTDPDLWDWWKDRKDR